MSKLGLYCLYVTAKTGMDGCYSSLAGKIGNIACIYVTVNTGIDGCSSSASDWERQN
jgi:hypothetical protein